MSICVTSSLSESPAVRARTINVCHSLNIDKGMARESIEFSLQFPQFNEASFVFSNRPDLQSR
jgi:hypothetical protein